MKYFLLIFLPFFILNTTSCTTHSNAKKQFIKIVKNSEKYLNELSRLVSPNLDDTFSNEQRMNLKFLFQNLRDNTNSCNDFYNITFNSETLFMFEKFYPSSKEIKENFFIDDLLKISNKNEIFSHQITKDIVSYWISSFGIIDTMKLVDRIHSLCN